MNLADVLQRALRKLIRNDNTLKELADIPL